jgi:hypothetical protein
MKIAALKMCAAADTGTVGCVRRRAWTSNVNIKVALILSATVMVLLILA